MPQRPHPAPTPLDELMTRAEGYADFSMRQIGRVPPALLAKSPDGLLHFTPTSLADERAKNHFANTARLICVAYRAAAAVLVIESWMKLAKPGESLDPTEPPSEALDRQEVVALMGEVPGQQRQRILPIIRTDAGGFFGFGDFDVPEMDEIQGRFAQMFPPKQPPGEARQLARAMLTALGVTEQSLRGDWQGN
jgi:hypothetical protein